MRTLLTISAIVVSVAAFLYFTYQPNHYSTYHGLPSQTMVAQARHHIGGKIRQALRNLQIQVETPPPVEEDPEWESWCEDTSRIRCSRVGSEECPQGPDGRPMACVLPWWDDGRNEPVCSPKFPTRSAQRQTQQHLRQIVAKLCSPPSWWERGMAMSPYCWRHKRGKTCNSRCNPDALTAFLSAIALRESSWRPWKRHKLNPDIEAALAAWERRRDAFVGSLHYHDKERWGQGAGLFGMNPALFLDAWDPAAPPETLCRMPEATLTALRRLRAAWHKYAAGIPCDGSTYHGAAVERSKDGEWVRPLPTWTDLHRAVWVGSLCPVPRDRLFRRRANRAGLNPDKPVTLEMLGKPVDRQRQDRAADMLRATAGA